MHPEDVVDTANAKTLAQESKILSDQSGTAGLARAWLG